MITLSDQLNLANILTLEPRKSNVRISGNYIIVETLNEYLLRVLEENRYLGMEVVILSPSGSYDINAFVSLINSEQIIYTKYAFVHTILDAGFIYVSKEVINNLLSDSTVDALSAAQGKELKSLIDNLLSAETDPIFTAWIDTTPPAYPGDIPTALADLTEDTTHRIVTDSEKSSWNSKAEGNHNHTGVYEPANANIQSHVVSTSNPHNVTKTQIGLSNVPNIDTTNPANIVQNTGYRFATDTEKATWNAKQPAGVYSTDIHSNIVALNSVIGVNTGDQNITAMTHANRTALDLVSGTNTGDQDLSGYSLTTHDHTGIYAPVLGSDDNYVTDIEKAALHAHSNKIALDNVSGTNTGDETTLSITTKLGTTLSNKLDYNGNGSSLTGITTTQIGAEPANANIQSHISSTSNPHTVTKTQVGLSNVPNVDATNPTNIIQDTTHRFTTDSEKSVWNAKQDALGYTPENVANIRTSFQVIPDNTHYPSEKLVKDSLDGKQVIGTYSTDIHSNITALNTVSGTNTGDNATNTQYSGLVTSKQNTLISGTNIKTINGVTVLGSGDITIAGAGGDVTGPISAIDGNVAIFSGTSGKILKDTGVVVSGINTGDSAGHNLLVPYTGSTTDTDIGTHAIKASKYQFKTDAVNTLSHGELGWNEHDLTMDLKTNGATLQINQEQVFPIKNATAGTLLNGRLVKITGYSSADDYYTVVYSDNTSEATSFVDFMLTENIAPGAIGLGTKIGLVHDLDTSAGTISGIVYLGTNGNFTAVPPTFPNKTVIVGIFGNINATTGDIFVDLARSTQYNINTINTELDLKGMQNPGICQKCPIYPIDIVIDTTALTLTIATIKGGQTITTANPIRFFTDGSGIINKWEKTTSVTFPAFTNTTGIWYFYFNDSGIPVTTQNIWSEFSTIATVYRFYWNATLSGANRLVVESFEAHQNDISAADHAWKHAQGSIYENGLDITSNFLTTGTPNIDGRNTCLSLSGGKCSDDGLEWTVTSTITPINYFEQDLGNIVAASLTSTNAGLFKIRTNDVNGLLSFLPATRFPFLWNTVNNRPQYLTTTGVATDVPDDNWFVYYIYNLSDRKVGSTIKITSAEIPFTSLALAQGHNWETMRSLYATLKDNEIRPLYKVIFFTNSVVPSPYNVACKYTVIREISDIRTQKTTTSVASAGSSLASNVIVTPSGDISSTNVQSALIELDTEKLPLVGANTITTVGTIITGTWNADSISVLKGGTGLNTLGTALQLLRVNSGATALEYFTPTFTGTVTSVATDGLALTGGPITTTGTITHSTTSGYKHIPSGGVTGQFLKWSADGTATWSIDNDTIYTHPTYTYNTPTADTVITLSSIPLISTLLQTNGHVTGGTYRKLVAGTNVTIGATSDGNITLNSSYVDTNTITRIQGTGGTLVSGDILIQGTGNISTSQLGNTVTITSNLTNLNQLTNGPGYTTNVGTVTSIVAGTGLSGGTITTSGTIALATAYGDTINPYASKTANYFLATPDGIAGSPTFRAIVAADIPTLNQNTTGTAATITGVYGGTLTSSQITTGLTYTPYNATNPNGYTTNVGTIYSLTVGTGLNGGTITTSGSISVIYGSLQGTSCEGNDSRLSNARIASDVYTWAKQATKPTYTYSEVGAQAPLVSGTNIKTINGTTVLGSGNITIDSATVSVAQTTHGFVAGNIIRVSGANSFIKAQADNSTNAEVVGYVTEVIDSGNFKYIPAGFVTTGVPIAAAGTTLYLDSTTAGTLTSTEPITVGQVSKPLLIIIESGAKAVFVNFRGMEITNNESGITGEIWTSLIGTYVSASTFTFLGTDKHVNLIQLSLLTLTDSTGLTRRIGYVKSAVNNAGTITATVVTDTDLVSGDKDFKIAYNRKATDYMRLITIPGECIADTSYSQGMFYADIQTNSYLLPVDVAVLTAASGSGAACTFNVYKNTTNLFSAAPDLGTNTVLRSQRPTTNTISAAENISLRITSSVGATNKAADFQAKLYIIPTLIYTSF